MKKESRYSIQNTAKYPAKYNAVDLVKLFFAFVVVAIHTHPLEMCSSEFVLNIYDSICQAAVPYFFIAMGFFFGKKLSGDDDQSNYLIIKNRIKQLLKMYLLWMLLYTPLAIIHFCEEQRSFISSVAAYAIGLVFRGEQFGSWILWYLLSSVYALIIIVFLNKKAGLTNKKLIVMTIVASVVYVVMSAVGNNQGDLKGILYYVWKVINYVFTSGRIFLGSVYLPIGILISRCEGRLLNEKLRFRGIAITLLVGGGVGHLIIRNALVDLIFTAVLALSIFVLTILSNDFGSNNTRVFLVMRSMSRTIYFIHLYVWSIYYLIIYGTIKYGVEAFLVTSIVSSIIALLYSMSFS